VRLRKESERQADKYKLLSTGTSSQKEAELQKEVDKLMVRFSLPFLRLIFMFMFFCRSC
jgi:hypothetical protein